MSIGSKLALTLAIFLMGMFVVTGVLATRLTRDTLVDQVDAQVLADVARSNPGDNGPDRDHDDRGPRDGNNQTSGDVSTQGADPSGESTDTLTDDSSPSADQTTTTGNDTADDSTANQRSIAHFVYSSDGALLVSEPCGYSDDPKTPPTVPPIPSGEIDSLVGKVVTTPATDDSLDYRMTVSVNSQGNYLVTAAPLDQVDATLSDIKVVFAVLFAGAVALCAAFCWFIIKRGLRPVGQMVATASAIAGGNMEARVDVTNSRTELGRLGTALNLMLTNIDRAVSARQASEDRLRRFVADAAHELRTPLTSLRGYAELHRQGILQTPEQVDNAMSRIESEGARMARLVDDLLLLARLDQQRGLEKQPFDLVALVNEAAQDFQVTSPGNPLTVRVPETALISGDKLRLRQVIDNLLGNARLHTPPGTRVEILVKPEKENVRLVILDHGPGISPDDQARVFERFWRADPARTRSKGGSGLGLAIVDSLVQAHGGSIELTSEPGKGAIFSIDLPAAGT